MDRTPAGRLPRFSLLLLAGFGIVLAGRVASGGADQWTTSFPSGFPVLSLAVDPHDANVVYAGTPQALYKTLDGGATWGIVGTLPPGSPIWSLAIDGTSGTVYAGTHGNADVFRSADGGSTWDLLSFGSDYHSYPKSLAVDPTGPGTVYAGLAPITGLGTGLLKSSDGGMTWAPKTSGLPISLGFPTVSYIAVDPAAPATVYVGLALFGVYKSVNGAEHWSLSGLQNAFPQYSVNALVIDPAATSTLYAGTNLGIFKSTDGARNWNESDAGLGSSLVNALAIDPTNSRTLYAGTETGGVFRSVDGGATWGAWNDGLSDSKVQALATDAAGKLVHAGTPSGVFDRNSGSSPQRLVVRPPRRRPAPRVVNFPLP